MSSVAPLNVKFLLILQWISNELQANVLTFLENWYSQAKGGKRGQKDDLLRRRRGGRCERNGIVLSWTGQLGGKRRLQVGEQAPAALQLLPCFHGQVQKGSPFGRKPQVLPEAPLQCPAQKFWFMEPDWLSQPYHLLPSWSLGIKKWTHGVAPYRCPALVCLCLHSRLHGSGQDEPWDPSAEPWHRTHASPLTGLANAVHWLNWNQPGDCTWHLGDFLAPCSMGKEGTSGWQF